MLLSALLSSKAAAAAVGAVLLAGGASAAVALPAVVGADKPPVGVSASGSESSEASEDVSDDATESSDDATESSDAAEPSGSATPGPDASGPAAYGLCNAWSHGGLTQAKADAGNPAAKALVAAAGEGTVEDYCAAFILEKKGTQEATPTDGSTAESSHHGSAGKAKAAEKKAAHKPTT